MTGDTMMIRVVLVALFCAAIASCVWGGSPRHVDGVVSSVDASKECVKAWNCTTWYTFHLRGESTEYYANDISQWPHVGDHVTFDCKVFDADTASQITHWRDVGKKEAGA